MFDSSKKAARSQMMCNRFVKKYAKGATSASEIDSALIKASVNLSKDSWRQYRLAFMFAFQISGDLESATNIEQISYQDARRINNLDVKTTKAAHCKKVSEAEHQSIVDKIMAKKRINRPLLSVIQIVRETGARPAEIDKMSFDHQAQSVSIIGAKKILTKDEDGKSKNIRGLDRTLFFDETVFTLLVVAHGVWRKFNVSKLNLDTEATMKLVQNQFATLTEKIWPNRKRQITLKTYRHQMGSNLKASGMDRITTAAIMGHQSVDSLTCYGNAKSSTRNLNISVNQESINNVRKTDLKESPQKALMEKEAKRRNAKVPLL